MAAIYSTEHAFAALKADGSIMAWGGSTHGGSGEPTDSDYIKIYSTEYAFAALKADGSITAWGNSKYGGIGAPTDNGYIKIYSTKSAFVALKADGSRQVHLNKSWCSHCQWVRLCLHTLSDPTPRLSHQF
jgi:alpha-tubulin suppressor-like RCC1 family protein